MISLIRFHASSPQLQPRPEISWEKNGIFNPGVAIYNGRILLLYRAVGKDNISRFGVATSKNGTDFNFWSDQPVFTPYPESEYETLGVENPRITFLEGKFAIVYTAAAFNNTLTKPNTTDLKTRISLVWTTDFVNYNRQGVIMHSYNDKDAALFPQKWGDYYYLYHRRHPSIWLSKSTDLNTWEDVPNENYIILSPSETSWDNDRVGIGAPPIYTRDGWIVFYHGRDKQGVYRLGVFMADLKNPQKIIYKIPYPILEPRLEFEKSGKINNVVFTCGAVEVDTQYFVYYGGADYAIGGAFIRKLTLLNELKKYPV